MLLGQNGVVGAKHSAGILLYRRPAGVIEVLLAHMGGPFWTRRDAGAWSIPKGEYSSNEEPEAAARREFTEELGLAVPAGALLSLGDVKQSAGKVVTAWALEGDLDPTQIVPGTFQMEWPLGSGQTREFPEVDRVDWFTVDEARKRIVAGQRFFLDRLVEGSSARVG